MSVWMSGLPLCARSDFAAHAKGGRWSPPAQAPVDDPETDIRTTVQRLLDDLKLRRVHVAVAVPAGAAIVRRLSLPAGSPSDLARPRRPRSRTAHAVLRSEDASVSYQVLGSATGGSASSTDSDILDVLLGAARRAEVAERTGWVTGRGRRVSVADVEGLALANAFSLNYPDQSDSALLLHVGHRSTVICVIERGELIATRGVGLGGGAQGSGCGYFVRLPLRRVPGACFSPAARGQADGLSSRLAAEFGAHVEAFDPRRRIRTSAASRGADLVGPPFALAVGLALRRKGDG